MGWVKQTLDELDVKPSKNRGQNFLNSHNDSALLVCEAGIENDEVVIEIGPGLGSMTEVFIENGIPVVAVEIENKFVRFLENKFNSRSDLIKILNLDFRDILFSKNLCPDAVLGKSKIKYRLVSNVPYVLSSEVVLWLIKNRSKFSGASILVQREFAERINASPHTKAYGSLSVLCQLYAFTRLGVKISGDQFHPKAGVESQQIHFSFPGPFEGEIDNQPLFEKIVRASFSMRRKMLVNNLLSLDLVKSKIECQRILESISLSTKVRAEDLSVEQFIKLYNILKTN
ncbi:MAG TPA: 16S rRNA (adenine(1518)-N(6)/adenine(1519)-N(6))-dimethyltransferase RsmA [Oligoflexia bacterium]|nr:16S rRNA (adenine(1518)-N(6)/adenine(1519)-N(6))-dimethyltransferase RsmA [Oligoflexia bacterium]HMP48660.1 16S rRNA (adenine(1518)-N(6)/adenine(1519)-N(6))-dimethyltransferase RsmA [Oligoflexia bacterium]